MSDYYCRDCEWEGNELVEDLDGDMVCPECESENWGDADSVGPNDYQDQNPREKPCE